MLKRLKLFKVSIYTACKGAGTPLCFGGWNSWKIYGNEFSLFLLSFWKWNWIFFLSFFVGFLIGGIF